MTKSVLEQQIALARIRKEELDMEYSFQRGRVDYVDLLIIKFKIDGFNLLISDYEKELTRLISIDTKKKET